MARTQWRHPRHNRPAACALLMNIIALVLLLMTIVSTLFYNDRTKSKKMFTLMSADVNCENDICIEEEGGAAGWQKASTYLITASLVINGLSVFCQALLFWPFALFGKVMHPFMRISQILDIIGAPLKFVASFILVFHCNDVNYAYSWRTKNNALGMDTMPLGLALCSFVFQILSFMGLTLALDTRPRGGLTYWEIMEKEQLQEHPKEAEMFKRYSYMPDVKETHSRVLSSSKLNIQRKHENETEF